MTPIINLNLMVEPPPAAYYLRFPAPRAGFFLLSGLYIRPRERNQREGRPDGANTPLRFSPESALASTRRARNTRLGLKHEARFSRFRLRCSGAPYGVG